MFLSYKPSTIKRSFLVKNLDFSSSHLIYMVSCICESTLHDIKVLSIRIKTNANLNHKHKVKGNFTCPNFVRKLLAKFKDVIVTSSLAFSAWAMAKAPSSWNAKQERIGTANYIWLRRQKRKSPTHTLISLYPRSSEVRASLTTFKLRAKQTAPCYVIRCNMRLLKTSPIGT